MDIQAVFREIRDFCEANRDAEIVKKYSRYFKEGYDAYGLTGKLLEDKVREIADREDPTMDEVIALTNLLIPETKYELPAAAWHFYNRMKKHYSRGSFRAIDHWFDIGVTNWAHCDGICMELVKVHLRKQLATTADLEPWRFSPRPFKRRAALVSMIYAMKGGFHAAKVLSFAAPLMTDTERVVHQGAGWLLRETWKKDPLPVEAFLLKWKDTAPRLIFQYATEKMSKENKARFRKAK